MVLAQVLGLIFFLVVVVLFMAFLFGVNTKDADAAVLPGVVLLLVIFSFFVGAVVTDSIWTYFVVSNNIFEWAIDDKGWSFIRMVK